LPSGVRRGAAPKPTPSPISSPSPTPTPASPRNQRLDAFAGPVLLTTTSAITPTGTLRVSGENLGTQPGLLQLEGDFPGTGNAPGGVATLQVESWTDQQVQASLPSGLRGAPDQTAHVLLMTADGRPSNTLDIQFVATRETIPLDGRMLQVTCSSSTSDADLCFGNQAGLGGSHMSVCCFNGVGGTDEYAIALANGWGFARLELTENRADEESLIAFDSVLAQVPPCVTVDGPGTFLLEGPPAFGASTIDLKVDWYVSANCSPVNYSGVMYITGPAGVPYVL
jgi:hypothetical protein